LNYSQIVKRHLLFIADGNTDKPFVEFQSAFRFSNELVIHVIIDGSPSYLDLMDIGPCVVASESGSGRQAERIGLESTVHDK